MNTNEGKQGARSLAGRCIAGIDNRWPTTKYLSLALYAAWILLTMTSGSTLEAYGGQAAGHNNALLYLLSGVPLAACLLIAGVFHKQARKAVDNNLFIIVMGILASISTFVLASGIAPADDLTAFAIASIGTGLGTSFLCLRIGCIYGDMPHGNPFLVTAGACLLSNLIYFMCVGVPGPIKTVIISLLPFLAALCSSINANGAASPEQVEEERIRIASLSRGYLPRLFASVFMMCISIGIIRGLAGLWHSPEKIAWESDLCIFISFVALGIIAVVYAAVLSVRNFEISKIYFPIIIVTASLAIFCTLFGQYIDTVKSIVINTGYNIFIVVIWCILQDVSSRTDAGPVHVYGLGRGASAAGTTIGWFIAFTASGLMSSYTQVIPVVFMVTALLVLAAAVTLMTGGTISIALMHGYEQTAAARTNGRASDPARSVQSFSTACAQLAQEMHLTPREEETLELLGKGRTIGFVAEELGISYNTVKGYAKNVYAKCGVHSRQELIDIIEKRLS